MQVQLGLLVLLVTFSQGSCQSRDDTLVEKAKERDVSEAAIRKIQRSGIFTDDQDFLRRLAYVESRFGESDATYRDGYFGGIWQVDETYFNQTKQNTTLLSPVHRSINTIFNINWSNVTWNDLLKPLYSGLAARLYFVDVNKPIPGTIGLQSQFWKANYRVNGSAENFTLLVRELESRQECEGVLDMCIVLDGSTSIGPGNFQTAREFVAKLVENVPLETSRVGLVLYSAAVQVMFPIQNNLTRAEMNSTIWNMPYPTGGTRTALGLQEAVKLFNSTTVRPGIPRVVTTLTDGQSTDLPGQLPNAIAEVKNASLASFAIGIGTGIVQSELEQIALGDTSKVLMVTDYDSLAEFMYRLNSATCEVPQEPEVGANQTDSLKEGEKRYFRFEIPTSGITILLEESAGKASGWYSYSEETPNSAIYDGVINGPTFIPFRNSTFRRTHRQGQPPSVFLTIQGNSGATNYTITSLEGNQVPSSGTSFIASWILILGIITSILFH